MSVVCTRSKCVRVSLCACRECEGVSLSVSASVCAHSECVGVSLPGVWGENPLPSQAPGFCWPETKHSRELGNQSIESPAQSLPRAGERALQRGRGSGYTLRRMVQQHQV